MRFDCHFFFSYHQRNVMIVHRAGKKILMKEMAEGTTTIYHICVTVSFMIQFLKSFKSAGSSSTHSCFKISGYLVHRWLQNVLILSFLLQGVAQCVGYIYLSHICVKSLNDENNCLICCRNKISGTFQSPFISY